MRQTTSTHVSPSDYRSFERIRSLRRAGFMAADAAHWALLAILDEWIRTLREIRGLP